MINSSPQLNTDPLWSSAQQAMCIANATIEPKFFCGPMKVKLPDSLMSHLMSVTDAEIANNIQPTAKDRIVARIFNNQGGSHWLNGKVNDQFKTFIEDCAEKYTELLQIKERLYLNERDSVKLALSSVWMVSQYSEDYNPLHWHYGKLSGVIYLKVPPQIDRETESGIKSLHGSTDGKIEFVYWPSSPLNFTSRGNAAVTPVVGDMYIFPAWVLHTVYPFHGDGERRIVSFNLT
jgi:hypothetical protein